MSEGEAKQVLVAYKDIRQRVKDKKLRRGFKVNVNGRSMKIDANFDLNVLRKKVRCFNCNELGHFSRDCKASRKPKNGGKEAGAGNKEVYYVYMRNMTMKDR